MGASNDSTGLVDTHWQVRGIGTGQPLPWSPTADGTGASMRREIRAKNQLSGIPKAAQV